MRAVASTFARFTVLVGGSFLLVAVIVWVAGFDPVELFEGTWKGAVAAPGALVTSVRWAIPICLIGMGVAVTFRAGYFNIGAQGQFYLGSIGAVSVGLLLEGQPAFLVIPLAIAVGVLGGALWALVPGFLRVRYGTDEVLTTLMMNFIAVLLVQYLAAGPLQDASGSGQVAASQTISDQYRISSSAGVSVALITLTALAGIAVWLLVSRSNFGLLSTLVGRNPLMSRWQGINVSKIGAWSFIISGALAGLAGALELLGPTGRLVNGASPSVGNVGILTALVGGLSVFGVALASLFFGGLQSAILYLPISSDLPQSSLQLLQALVILLITVGFVLRFRRRHRPMSPALELKPAAPLETTTTDGVGTQ